jgi:hypothetical protein
MANEDRENKLTEDEETIRQQLVKLGVDNNMYFVVWWGQTNNYFVGVRNDSKKQPQVYGAMYETLYDVVGKDKIMFKSALGLDYDWPNQRLPLHEMLRIVEEYIEKTRELQTKVESSEMEENTKED